MNNHNLKKQNTVIERVKLESRNQINNKSSRNYKGKFLRNFSSKKFVISFLKSSFNKRKKIYVIINQNVLASNEEKELPLQINPFIDKQTFKIIRDSEKNPNGYIIKNQNINSKNKITRELREKLMKVEIRKLADKYAENKSCIVKILNREINKITEDLPFTNKPVNRALSTYSSDIISNS